MDQANVEYAEVDYDELMSIDDQIQREYGHDQYEVLIDPVDFYSLRCMGYVMFANVKPVDDPAGIVEQLYSLKRDQMISMIQFCEKRGWDWDIDPYSMDVESKEAEYQDRLAEQRSFPTPGQ